MNTPLVKVTSPSFSKNETLILELSEMPIRVALNSTGERFEGDALARYLGDADAAIIGLEKVTAQLLDRCPNLRLIAKYGVGLDNVDLEACKQRGVRVGWTPGVNRYAVAEQTIASFIGMNRNLFGSFQKLRRGIWEKQGGRQISGLTMGIIGLGNVGRELVRLLQPFGTRILANDITDIGSFCEAHGVIPATQDQIFAESDTISLHVPLTSDTRHMVNDRTLGMMKSDAFLINTSRGEVIDQAALKRALKAGRIGGAALDVYVSEPPADLEFLKLPNLVCTPHVAGNSYEAVVAMGRSAIAHVHDFYGFKTVASEARKGAWGRGESLPIQEQETPIRGQSPVAQNDGIAP